MAKQRAESKKYHKEFMEWYKKARKESAAKRKEYLAWLKAKKKEAAALHKKSLKRQRAFAASTGAYSKTLGYEKDDPRYKKYLAKYKKAR